MYNATIQSQPCLLIKPYLVCFKGESFNVLLNAEYLFNVDELEDLVRDEKRAKFCPSFDTVQVSLAYSNLQN